MVVAPVGWSMRLVRWLGKILLYLWDGLNVWCPICLLCKKSGCDVSRCPIAKLDIRVGAFLEDIAYGVEE